MKKSGMITYYNEDNKDKIYVYLEDKKHVGWKIYVKETAMLAKNNLNHDVSMKINKTIDNTKNITILNGEIIKVNSTNSTKILF